MVSFFNIWHPDLLDAYTLTFDVTPAQAALVRDGTHEFVVACLRACGLPVQLKSWQIRLVRQSYYSDYSHSADWRARWDIAWVFEVVLSAEAELPKIEPGTLYRVDAQDETALEDEEPPALISPALLLVSFESDDRVEREIGDVLLRWARERRIESAVVASCRPHLNGRTLLRAVVDHLAFPESIPDLELLRREWSNSKGITNRHDII